jgi:putative transposase
VNPSRTAYDSDLTEAEWEQLEPLVPPVKPGGRPPKYSRREILNAIFYVTRSG